MSQPVAVSTTAESQAEAAWTAHDVSQREAIELLARARWKVAAVLTTAILVTYFGFIGLVAFRKEAMGVELVPGLSWGILLGALVIATAFGLTFTYVRWANGKYDASLRALRDSRRHS